MKSLLPKIQFRIKSPENGFVHLAFILIVLTSLAAAFYLVQNNSKLLTKQNLANYLGRTPLGREECSDPDPDSGLQSCITTPDEKPKETDNPDPDNQGGDKPTEKEKQTQQSSDDDCKNNGGSSDDCIRYRRKNGYGEFTCGSGSKPDGNGGCTDSSGSSSGDKTYGDNYNAQDAGEKPLKDCKDLGGDAKAACDADNQKVAQENEKSGCKNVLTYCDGGNAIRKSGGYFDSGQGKCIYDFYHAVDQDTQCTGAKDGNLVKEDPVAAKQRDEMHKLSNDQNKADDSCRSITFCQDGKRVRKLGEIDDADTPGKCNFHFVPTNDTTGCEKGKADDGKVIAGDQKTVEEDKIYKLGIQRLELKNELDKARSQCEGKCKPETIQAIADAQAALDKAREEFDKCFNFKGDASQINQDSCNAVSDAANTLLVANSRKAEALAIRDGVEGVTVKLDLQVGESNNNPLIFGSPASGTGIGRVFGKSVSDGKGGIIIKYFVRNSQGEIVPVKDFYTVNGTDSSGHYTYDLSTPAKVGLPAGQMTKDQYIAYIDPRIKELDKASLQGATTPGLGSGQQTNSVPPVKDGVQKYRYEPDLTGTNRALIDRIIDKSTCEKEANIKCGDNSYCYQRNFYGAQGASTTQAPSYICADSTHTVSNAGGTEYFFPAQYTIVDNSKCNNQCSSAKCVVSFQSPTQKGSENNNRNSYTYICLTDQQIKDLPQDKVNSNLSSSTAAAPSSPTPPKPAQSPTSTVQPSPVQPAPKPITVELKPVTKNKNNQGVEDSESQTVNFNSNNMTLVTVTVTKGILTSNSNDGNTEIRIPGKPSISVPNRKTPVNTLDDLKKLLTEQNLTVPGIN